MLSNTQKDLHCKKFPVLQKISPIYHIFEYADTAPFGIQSNVTNKSAIDKLTRK